MNTSPESRTTTLEGLISEAAAEGKITCARLRKLAEEAGVSYKEAGKVADALKIRIKNCDLGCF